MVLLVMVFLTILSSDFKTHKRKLSKEGFTVAEYKLFSTSGYKAQAIEKNIKKNFKECPQVVERIKTEATDLVSYEDVCNFISKLSSEENVLQ